MKTAKTTTLAEQKRQTHVSAPLGVTVRELTLSSSRMGVAAVETDSQQQMPQQEEAEVSFREHFRF